jgi:hypothetical protein
MKSETEDPFGIVRPSQPPAQAFESPFISWPVKRIFEHFKANYYEPFKDVDSPDAPKIAGHNCVILDERTLSDGTCLLVSDTPAGDLYDKDLPHTARCEVGFALCVLGDCEIMNGDLVEYNMNYGDNPDHVLRDNDDGGWDDDDNGDDNDDNDDDDDDDDDDDNDDDDGAEDDKDDGEEAEKEQEEEAEDQEGQDEENQPGKEGAEKDDAGHRSKRRKV